MSQPSNDTWSWQRPWRWPSAQGTPTKNTIHDRKTVGEYEKEIRDLKQENTKLNEDVRSLNDKVQALEQGQEFTSYDPVPGSPHGEVQRYLRGIQSEITRWTHKVLQDLVKKRVDIPYLETLENQVPEFRDARRSISQRDASARVLQEAKITIPTLFGAIASNIIVRQAVLNPLGPCTHTFRDIMNSDIYKTMSSDKSEANQKAAKVWQAACLKMYYGQPSDKSFIPTESTEFSHHFDSAHHKSAARKHFKDSINSMVSKALKPAFANLGLNFDDQEYQKSLQESIDRAVRMGEAFGKLNAGLVLMDKAWLQQHVDSDGYISPSDLSLRVDMGPGYSDDNTFLKGKLAIVIFPGLLKFGSDNGENWNKWTVWIPAKIELMSPEFRRRRAAVADGYQLHPEIARTGNLTERTDDQRITPPRSTSSHQGMLVSPDLGLGPQNSPFSL